MRTVCGGHALMAGEGAGNARRCRLLRAAWAVAGLVALLAVLVAVDAHADRRRQWTTYGSARGRLVVACDMTSDTCSDGRKITTTRPTPVPCEVAPGQWEMVPENTACISYRGLESWAATTSYVVYGAELDRSPWQAVDGATVQSLPTGGYRVSGTGSNSRIMQPGIPAVPGPHTLSCIARSVDETPQARMRIFWDASSPGSVAIPVTAEWAVHSITATVPEAWEGDISIHVFSRTGTVDVIGCWLTRTSTPGRACWGGEAPVTCAGDRHTISTEGWPTESGEISLVYTPQDVGIGSGMYMAATTASGEGRPSGFYLYRISATGALVFGLRRGDTISAQNTQELVWENGRSYQVRVRWSPERAEIWRDGVLLRSWVPTTVPDSHPDVAYIGINMFSGNPAQGSIRSLTVRSYKEVSP